MTMNPDWNNNITHLQFHYIAIPHYNSSRINDKKSPEITKATTTTKIRKMKFNPKRNCKRVNLWVKLMVLLSNCFSFLSFLCFFIPDFILSMVIRINYINYRCYSHASRDNAFVFKKTTINFVCNSIRPFIIIEVVEGFCNGLSHYKKCESVELTNLIILKMAWKEMRNTYWMNLLQLYIK